MKQFDERLICVRCAFCAINRLAFTVDFAIIKNAMNIRKILMGGALLNKDINKL